MNKEYLKKLELNSNYNKEKYIRQKEMHPNLCKEIYIRTLELHPNHNKEHYEKRIKQNPNFSKENYIKQKKLHPNYIKERYIKHKILRPKYGIERYNKFTPIWENLKSNGCAICGYDKYSGALGFHHTNPEDKKLGLNKKVFNYKNEILVEEINKCILLCANCHMEIEGLNRENKNMEE